MKLQTHQTELNRCHCWTEQDLNYQWGFLDKMVLKSASHCQCKALLTFLWSSRGFISSSQPGSDAAVREERASKAKQNWTNMVGSWKWMVLEGQDNWALSGGSGQRLGDNILCNRERNGSWQWEVCAAMGLCYIITAVTQMPIYLGHFFFQLIFVCRGQCLISAHNLQGTHMEFFATGLLDGHLRDFPF